MVFNKERSVERAKADLGERLGADAGEISEESVTDREFSDMSLGSAAAGEMAAQMIVSGWVIMLGHAGRSYEYRGDKYQLRLHNYQGRNYVIEG